MKKTSRLVRCSLIAAAYAVLTLAFPALSYGAIQVRISEALCILPFFMKEAIWGITIGCFAANLLGVSMGMTMPWDILVGTLATLIAAFITSKLKFKWLVPLPTVIANALLVGTMITYMAVQNMPPLVWAVNIATVGAGEIIACYALGMPLMFVVEKHLKGEKNEH